jgi:hypothetical protein
MQVLVCGIGLPVGLRAVMVCCSRVLLGFIMLTVPMIVRRSLVVSDDLWLRTRICSYATLGRRSPYDGYGLSTNGQTSCASHNSRSLLTLLP